MFTPATFIDVGMADHTLTVAMNPNDACCASTIEASFIYVMIYLFTRHLSVRDMQHPGLRLVTIVLRHFGDQETRQTG